jgi:hypothetical protein
MKYRKMRNYKYQLTETFKYPVEIHYPMVRFETKDAWVQLMNDEIVIQRGYCWDGPSGPTIDTESFMRGSLVHDAWYQLMRECPVLRQHRDYADRLLQHMCIKDGMYRWRAAMVYWGLKHFGAKNAGITDDY